MLPGLDTAGLLEGEGVGSVEDIVLEIEDVVAMLAAVNEVPVPGPAIPKVDVGSTTTALRFRSFFFLSLRLRTTGGATVTGGGLDGGSFSTTRITGVGDGLLGGVGLAWLLVR